jgi:hypothetical protein
VRHRVRSGERHAVLREGHRHELPGDVFERFAVDDLELEVLVVAVITFRKIAR